MVSSVPLGEVCDFIRGVAFDGDEAIDLPKEGYVPILRAGNIGDELYIRDDLVWVPEKRVSEEQYFQIGDIAICMASGSPAVLGKTAQLKENFMGSVGAFCGIIRPTKADPNYIAYWLKSPIFMAWRDSQANGVNIQNLRPNEVREIEIPLPPLTEQKRIASLLARADHLRQLRRTAHDLGDALLQSVFLEMFYSTESKWELSAVEDLAKKKNNAIRTGPFGSQLLHSEFTETGDVLVLGIDNAVQNEFSWGKPRYITTEKYQELKRYTVFPGDLIITIMATNGRVAVVPDNIPLAINTKHLCCITLDQNVCLPKYLQTCLLYHPKVLEQMGGSERGAVMPGLNMEIIKNLVVSVPPLSLQEEFAGSAARVESLRGRMGESERQVEELFESLLSQSFSS